MKKIFVVFLTLPLIQCGSIDVSNDKTKKDTLQNDTAQARNISSHSPANDFSEKDSIHLEFDNYRRVSNYMISCEGKPPDTLYKADKTFIKFGDRIIYSDSINNFDYYTLLKDYWPRLLKINNKYVYFFERFLGEENDGADLFIVTFDNHSISDTTSIQHGQYGIDLMNKMSDSELTEMYRKKYDHE